MGSPAQCRDQWVPVHGRKYFQDSAGWCNGALIFAELPSVLHPLAKSSNYAHINGIMERYNSPALLHSERYNLQGRTEQHTFLSPVDPNSAGRSNLLPPTLWWACKNGNCYDGVFCNKYSHLITGACIFCRAA